MDDYEKYLHYSLRFLSYRQRSEKEMRDKLAEKEAALEVIERVMAFLISHKFLNDEEFSLSWVRSRTNFRPKSKMVIKMELQKKGIAPEIIEQALQGNEDEGGMNDMEQAMKLVKKRIPRYKEMEKREINE